MVRYRFRVRVWVRVKFIVSFRPSSSVRVRDRFRD
jgi:hypothetical protein